jgi:cytochrome c553
MPSDEFTGISNQDLSDLLSYLKSLPKIDNDPGKTEVSPIFKFLAHIDRTIKILPAELVTDSNEIPNHFEPERSAAYGKYLSVTCTGCHGKEFIGGKIPGVPPDWPEAPNLTQTGVLANYTNEDFRIALRTGVALGGRKLNSQFMPYPVFKEFTDLEIDAIYAYLSSF